MQLVDGTLAPELADRVWNGYFRPVSKKRRYNTSVPAGLQGGLGVVGCFEFSRGCRAQPILNALLALAALARRAFAARWAISLHSPGVSFAAWARPPLNPPSLPSATAAGFFLRSGNRSTRVFAASGAPVACSTTRKAFRASSGSVLRYFLLRHPRFRLRSNALLGHHPSRCRLERLCALPLRSRT